MTQQQIVQFEKSLARAQSEGVNILGHGTVRATGQRCWFVQGQHAKYLVVRISGSELSCSCTAGQNGKYCKHRAVVSAELMSAAETEAVKRETAVMRPPPNTMSIYRGR